tara:strand:- start:28 stop:288 length:261 start_codon:yes stop_codon:yes gene_type:complete
MNKKYLIYSFLFIASISFHSFADHHDHFNSNEENIAECQACEENVEIQISKTKTDKVYLENSPKTNLFSRFVSFKTKSNLPRAPPS